MLGKTIPVHPRLGACVIVLIPDEQNEMFGRGDFRIHGDSRTPRMASEGCIVLGRAPRNEMAKSADRNLKVVAKIEEGTICNP